MDIWKLTSVSGDSWKLTPVLWVRTWTICPLYLCLMDPFISTIRDRSACCSSVLWIPSSVWSVTDLPTVPLSYGSLHQYDVWLICPLYRCLMDPFISTICDWSAHCTSVLWIPSSVRSVTDLPAVPLSYRSLHKNDLPTAPQLCGSLHRNNLPTAPQSWIPSPEWSVTDLPTAPQSYGSLHQNDLWLICPLHMSIRWSHTNITLSLKLPVCRPHCQSTCTNMCRKKRSTNSLACVIQMIRQFTKRISLNTMGTGNRIV